MAASSVPPRPALLWCAEIGRLVLGFGVVATLARTIGRDHLGVYLAVTSVVLLVPRLLDCGLPHAFGYFLRIEPTQLRSAGHTALRHLLFNIPVSITISWMIRYVPFEDTGALRLTIERWPQISVLILSELAMLLGQAACVPTNRFGSYAATVLVPPLALLACVATWSRSALTPSRMIDLLMATSLLGSAVMVGAFFRAVRNESGTAEFPRAAAYGYGLRTYASAVCKVVTQRFDRLFLVGVLGAAGYAQYSLAISVRDMAVVPANLHALTLRNQQIDMLAGRRNLNGARRVLVMASLAWLVLGLVGAAVLVLSSRLIVPMMFGSGYEGTAKTLRIVAFSSGLIAAMGFAWNHLYALNRPGTVTLLTVISAVLAIPIFAVSIWVLGPTAGAATAVVLWSLVAASASFITALVSKLH